MKKLLFLTTILFSVSSYADYIIEDNPSKDQVKEAKEKISLFLLSMQGVNGHGISLCDPVTGNLFTDVSEDTPVQYCIDISTDTVEAEEALLTLFPPAAKTLDGILIHTRYTGRYIAQ